MRCYSQVSVFDGMKRFVHSAWLLNMDGSWHRLFVRAICGFVLTCERDLCCTHATISGMATMLFMKIMSIYCFFYQCIYSWLFYFYASKTRFLCLNAKINETLQPFTSDFFPFNFFNGYTFTNYKPWVVIFDASVNDLFCWGQDYKCQRRLNERKSLCVAGRHSCYNGDIVSDSSV